MVRRLEVIIVYAVGLIQGLALVTVPAASAVFTDPDAFGFSDSQYGLLFLPQFTCAILGSLLGAKLARWKGLKTIFICGLIFNFVSMLAVTVSAIFTQQQPVAMSILFFANASLGCGFGLTLPMINIYAANFFPKRSAAAITALHTLLGTGTALAPILVAVLVSRFVWWAMPLSVTGCLAFLLILSLGQRLNSSTQSVETPDSASAGSSRRLTITFWLFALTVFIYGFSETIFANWAIIYLRTERLLPISTASYALATFWAMVTMGRLLTAVLSVRFPPSKIYQLLPVLILLAFLWVPKAAGGGMSIIAFGFAGLGCSAFFPLSFSFAQGRFPHQAEIVSGGLMASYMTGYGFASFGIGQIRGILDITLGRLYNISALLSLVLIGLAIYLTRNPKSQDV